MKKIALFIFEGMADYQITFASHLISSSGVYELVTISYDKNPVKGVSGITYIPEVMLEEMEYEDFEGIIIPGGWNGDYRNELGDLILYFKDNNKLVAGICGTGTIYLAKAGALENVTYTTPIKKWTGKYKETFGGEDPFNRENYVKAHVAKDLNVITAKGNSFIDFSMEICDFLNLFENKKEKETFRKMFS